MIRPAKQSQQMVIVGHNPQPVLATKSGDPLAVVVSQRAQGDTGAVGPPGPEGPMGPPGPEGDDGTQWFDGVGPPREPIAGAEPGDYYLDTGNGDVYVLTMSSTVTYMRSMVPGNVANVPPSNPRPLSLVPGGR